MKAIHGNLPVNVEYKLIGVEFMGVGNEQPCDNCGLGITTVATVEANGKRYEIGTDCACGLNDCNTLQAWQVAQASKIANQKKRYCSKIRKYQALNRLEIKQDSIYFIDTDGIWESRISGVDKWAKLAGVVL